MADEAGNDRKQWTEDRLQLLAASFSIGFAGFAVLDNHLHVLVRLDPEEAQNWSAEELPGKRNQDSRPGMVGSFSFGSYLLLVEYTGCLYRNGEARINAGVRDVFERLGTSAEFWEGQLQNMLRSHAFRGNLFAFNAESDQGLSARRRRRMANLSPQIAARSS